MPRTPDVPVAAVTETDGRFLVVEERINRRLVFNQPAGHVERGETLLAAVVREVHEETAWQFEPQALVGVYAWRNPHNGRAFMRFAFSGAVTAHDPQARLDRGIVATHWLSHAQLQERATRLRSPLVMRCIEDYLAGVRRQLAPIAHLDLKTALGVAALTI
jgi:8-oxo-dGTP pyrophosphatase MutT (NUDIX family)